uniref:Uncharacterized protein n=1 Tax=Branchiostoma floridae TaxID=7739 RepID=C3ZPJ4_BRAFL|eukprot:XP_002589480.1 hypothetical protein BRAFLDRAFT_88339 [Branchiostoma floridae]
MPGYMLMTISAILFPVCKLEEFTRRPLFIRDGGPAVRTVRVTGGIRERNIKMARRLAYCKVIVATSMVWFMLDVMLILYYSECDTQCEKGKPGPGPIKKGINSILSVGCFGYRAEVVVNGKRMRADAGVMPAARPLRNSLRNNQSCHLLQHCTLSIGLNKHMATPVITVGLPHPGCYGDDS